MRLFVALILTGIVAIIQGNSPDCPFAPAPTCNSTVTYYQENGQCNNIDNGFAGSADSSYERFLMAMKPGGDGAIPYKNYFGNILPSPREVSKTIFPCDSGNESKRTSLFTIFGTLLKFDMFQTSRESTDAQCCESCLGIVVNATTDPRIINGCNNCMSYKKPILQYDVNCTGGEIQGNNDVTHVIDASFMYSTPDYSGTLSNGKFDLTGGFLSKTDDKFSGVSDPINENPLVMALYHIFLREHNNLVDKMTAFGQVNPLEAAKKLMIGILQHITYYEYLPLLIGENLSAGAYDDKLLPMISNSFSVAYELALASMSRENVQTSDGKKKLNEMLNNATLVDTETELKGIITGMLNEAGLYINSAVPCSFRDNCKYSDIVSVLTQDSRFFSITPYMVWIALLNGTTVGDFPDLLFHDNLEITKLSNLYKYVYDIDFLSGAFTETVANDKPAGPTLLLLLRSQFALLQNADRFFFENSNVFDDKQLQEIKKVTMANLLCRNIDSLGTVKTNAFDMNSGDISCSQLPEIDFSFTGAYHSENYDGVADDMVIIWQRY
ncbi:peroxidase mlt-7-like [Octopus vulgaris]|uniref:Peroxidase mlt-7-like n=1 Tax=Octopus vulgaris TaxID=6645 RepID=A0AA36BN08_OCTVU|nr:peroxidase mlt-7-like [Octopus vulgaris]